MVPRWDQRDAAVHSPETPRRAFLATIAGSLLAAPFAAEAQRPGKMWRIGWLSTSTAETGASEIDGLRRGLRELSYVEGQNITIESRWAEGNAARLPEFARALVQLNVDILCTAGTPATLAGKQATAKIPIVFAGVAFPHQTGLVAGLAQPGGNLTGVSLVGPEYGKRLELLREVVPKLARVTLLYNDDNKASDLAKNETLHWAKALNVAVTPLGLHDRPSLETAMATMRRRLPDALMTTSDALLLSYRMPIVDFAARHHLVSMYGDRAYVNAGGLMFYGTSRADMWYHAATYVDRILKGTKPSDLPIEQPTKFELVINLKTAKALGLTIPSSLLQRADQVIE